MPPGGALLSPSESDSFFCDYALIAASIPKLERLPSKGDLGYFKEPTLLL